MKTGRHITTQQKIIALLGTMMILMLAAMYFYEENEEKALYLLLKEQEIENTRLLQKIIQSKSSGLETFAKDYTYWDEMVDFTVTVDTAWANANIHVSLPTYDVDFVTIYDSCFRRIYFTQSEQTQAIDSGIITPLLLSSVTAQDRVSHFFISNSGEIYEISTATIHPTSDPERESIPRGYFAAGRLWNPARLSGISELTGTDLTIVNLSELDSISSVADPHEFISKSFYRLNSWDKMPLSYIASFKYSAIVSIMHTQKDREFIFIVVFISSILIFMSVSLFFIVNKPIGKISASLKWNDPFKINDLLNKKSEYGEIARLINEFFLQKKKLLNEIAVRTETELKMKESEEKLKSSLKEKEVLLKEVHHRVKNNLQIIISLIRLQVNRIDDTYTVQQLKTILSRIRSISLVHEMLYRSDDLGKINFSVYIKKLTDSLNEMYINPGRRLAIEVSADEIYLGVDTAVPCAIIINELVTNSIKHAFNGNPSGKIDISMKRGTGNYKLIIQDNGKGMKQADTTVKEGSLGMHLVNTLAEQLDADVNISNTSGTSFTFCFSEN